MIHQHILLGESPQWESLLKLSEVQEELRLREDSRAAPLFSECRRHAVNPELGAAAVSDNAHHRDIETIWSKRPGGAIGGGFIEPLGTTVQVYCSPPRLKAKGIDIPGLEAQ